IYWPIMLHALGFPDEQMPKFLVHGWWNMGGTKMSKSLGNVIDPDELANKYSEEALRYYLMSDIVTGKDSDFSEERLIERYNADLANSLGNLLNRSLNMASRYCSAGLSRGETPAAENSLDTLVRGFVQLAGEYAISLSLENSLQIAREANQFIEQTAPWKMAKQGMDGAVAEVIYDLAERLRIIAILVSPVLPQAAHGIFDQLHWKMELSGREDRFSLGEAEWGELPDGHVVGKPVPLFPRIEPEAG
ncbi:MAG: class I tRNA ligase family protein, partial [Spartobacteria bacterium]